MDDPNHSFLALIKVESHCYVQQITSGSRVGKNQSSCERAVPSSLAQISNTGKREGRKEKINMRLESVRFPFDPSVREKLSDDDLAKGVKLKFMAEIDFKCFSKVVKWSFFAQQTLYNGVTFFMKLQAFLDLCS